MTALLASRAGDVIVGDVVDYGLGEWLIVERIDKAPWGLSLLGKVGNRAAQLDTPKSVIVMRQPIRRCVKCGNTERHAAYRPFKGGECYPCEAGLRYAAEDAERHS